MDYWYKSTNDLEAYKPDAVSTRACDPAKGENCDSPGALSIKITYEVVNVTYAPETWGPAPKYNLNYKSGMVQGW